MYLFRMDPAKAWLVFAIIASILLPWYAVPDDFSWSKNYVDVFTNSDAGNGWIQAFNSRIWVLVPLVAILSTASVFFVGWKLQGVMLTSFSLIGICAILGFGFAIGTQGWSIAALQASRYALENGHVGIGWGGLCVLTALIFLAAIGIARLGYFQGDNFVSGAVIGCSFLLILFVGFPVSKALSATFINDDGQFSVIAALSRVFGDRVWGMACLYSGSSCGVAWNTLLLGIATALGTTILGTLLAFLTERSFKRAKALVGILATLPLITPPFVVGLGLILLFGRAGLVNQFLEINFHLEPSRWFYGAHGVWLAQMFAFTPTAFLMMRSSVQVVAPTLEEAAQTLRASPVKALFTVTLPLLKPALTNTFLVAFVESMADFGNPIVVGGHFSVLSTEIFFAIVGAQLDHGRAASLALILTAFALIIFSLQRWILGKANYTSVSGKGDNGIPPSMPPAISLISKSIALPWLAFTVVIYVLAFAGGFVKVWGRDYSFTLDHFKNAFGVQWLSDGIVLSGSAWNSLITTLELAGASAPLTALLGLLIAYVISRTVFKGRNTFEFVALLAFAIPGTVLGVSYILAFNVPPFELTGTGIIILLCYLFRNLPVSIRSGIAAFKQMDKSLDEASLMLGASTFTTLRLIILPLIRPTLIAALLYSFVRAMTTVSAVIFLVTAEHELATTFIIGRVGNGDYGVALAYCSTLIVMMLAAIGIIKLVVGERKLGRRTSET